MTELQNDPAVYLERAARILGIPLSSECLSDVIANHENFHALFQTITGFRKSSPLDVHRR